jgi:energy-coupling factor transporter ATP-binding protein EcfA2
MDGTLGDFAINGVAAVAAVVTKTPAHRVDWGQVLATAGIWAGIVGAIAAVIAIVPMTRNGVRWAGRALVLRTGLPHRRYAKKFIREFGSYENPYLGEYEKIDLRSTYVPLSFQTEDAQSYAIATQVLTQLRAEGKHPDDPAEPGDRLIITGDPGSGKSTLLKAYGVGILEDSHVITGGAQVVPYFVRLRELAKFITPQQGLAEYITGEILKRQGFFDAERGKAFFAHTVSSRQAVVLLDGLDEVPDDKQRAVLGAVRAFMRDESEDCPTRRSTILLTCRTQNFQALRDNWIPAFTRPGQVYALAPLRDSEIVRYVQKFRHKFKTADGPAQFMRSVRGSGKAGTDRTIDLLRAPLVLAMAVGLYAHRPTRIPNTIAKLYQAMVEEMLERHGFKQEAPEDSLLHYRTSDKYRFLRRFALHAVQKSGQFGDFAKPELISYSAELAPSLEAVDNPAGLVEEIITHSNLLTPQEHSDLYFFAHQSIQEFLAAEELQHQRVGDAFLLARATDMNWRQAIQFYTAGREAGQVDEFVTGLAKQDSELAGYCLRAASPSDGAARAVLDALKPITDARLNALAAASRSPRVPVQRMAIEELKRFLADSRGAASMAGTGIDGMLPLLESLAGTNAGEIAALVPQVIRDLPNDPRLVGPLWQCLSADGIESHKEEATEIAQRLLAIVTELDGFTELAEQDPHDHESLSAFRPVAYPFNKALSPGHNLITLLAWADYLSAVPGVPNRFFDAKAAGKLGGVEAARARTIKVSFCWPARVFSAGILIAALVTALIVLDTAPGRLLHPFGWWTPVIAIAVGALPVAIVFLQTWLEEEYSINSDKWFSIAGDEKDSGNIIFAIPATTNRLTQYLNDSMPAGFIFATTVSAAFGIAPIDLASSSLVSYFLVAIGSHLAYWETAMALFGSDRHYFLRRPNEFVDIYDDPKVGRWVAQAKNG